MPADALLSETEKREIWHLRSEGLLPSQIAQAIGRGAPTVFKVIKRNGGIDPGMRARSTRHLSIGEREEISLGKAKGISIRQIARKLNRSPSTICRELKRHSSARGDYRAVEADRAAWKLGERPKTCKLASHKRLQNWVVSKLLKKWSPEQISRESKIAHLGDVSMQISHEAIYRTLFIQSRGALKKELQSELRQGRKYRKCSKKNPEVTDGRGQIVGAISIRERPAEVEDRALPGHWEGDLIAGTNNSYIATLVERATRFVVLVKVDSKRTTDVVTALIKQMKKLPDILKGSLTWDRGSELQQHAKFALATGIDVYFCDPRSPWQRGSNENTNGLLRQYFPKGTCLSEHSQRHLNKVAKELNERPRKTLDGQTPAQKYFEVLH